MRVKKIWKTLYFFGSGDKNDWGVNRKHIMYQYLIR